MEQGERANAILHVFDWTYREVAEHASEIKSLGYRSVMVSPPLKSMKSDRGKYWWQRYQPQDYRVIDNPLGNTLDFKAMMAELHCHDIWVYVDVVFNHMANESDIRSDLQFPSDADMQEYHSNPELYSELRLFGDLSVPLFIERDFIEPFGIVDWQDQWEVQNGRISSGPADPGLPTLSDNLHVIEQQRLYLKAMKEMGVRGFRIDAAKHISLSHLEKVWTPDITEGMHIFGEIITDGGATRQEYEVFLKPYLEKTQLAAYDFPLFNTLFNALGDKGSFESLVNPYALGQALSNPRAVTFATTHDIPNNRVFEDLVMSESNEWLAYAYILGRDGGVPLIYAEPPERTFSEKENISRWAENWRSQKMKSLLEFHNLTYGHQMKVEFVDKDVIIISRGKVGLIALNKGKNIKSVDELLVSNTSIDYDFKCISESLEIKPNSYLIIYP